MSSKRFRSRRARALRAGVWGAACARAATTRRSCCHTFKAALVPSSEYPLRAGFVGESATAAQLVHQLDEKRTPLMAERYAQSQKNPGRSLRCPCGNEAQDRRGESRHRSQPAALSRAKPVVACAGAEYGPSKRWPARHLPRSRTSSARWATPFGCSARKKSTPSARRSPPPAKAREQSVRRTISRVRSICFPSRSRGEQRLGTHARRRRRRRPLVRCTALQHEHTPPLARAFRIVRTGIECSRASRANARSDTSSA